VICVIKVKIRDGEWKKIRWRKNLTINGLLKQMKDNTFYPTVFVNKIGVSYLKFDEVIIPNHSEVWFIPYISGG
jgi:hypothetical protein